MKRYVRCPICGVSDTVNGEVRGRELMREHLRLKHPAEYEGYMSLVEEVRNLEERIRVISKASKEGYGLFIR